MHPQYYDNTLNPIAINEANLQTTLRELQAAVQRGTLLVHEGSPPPSEWGSGGYYVGNSGKTAMTRRMGCNQDLFSSQESLLLSSDSSVKPRLSRTARTSHPIFAIWWTNTSFLMDRMLPYYRHDCLQWAQRP